MVYYRRSEQRNDILLKCNKTKKSLYFFSIKKKFVFFFKYYTSSRFALICFAFILCQQNFTYSRTTITLDVEAAVLDRAKLTRCSQKSELARGN